MLFVARGRVFEVQPCMDPFCVQQHQTAALALEACGVVQGCGSLQQVNEAQRAARQHHLVQRAERRESQLKEARAMQKDHHAAVRRAKPRVHRAELRRVGEQFAARAGDSKTAGQMSHVAAFIVPESASPSGLIRSQEGSDKPGRASPRMWTHDGLMRIRHTAAADAQPDVSEVGAAAGKPWRRAPDQRTGSHGPMVQILSLIHI